MTDHTKHLALSYLVQGGNISDEDWKVLGRDRDIEDLVGWLGASAHHHNGLSPDSVAPTLGLSLALDQSAGVLPAGKRIYYKYTLVDDRDIETTASPEAFLDTPAPIVEPAAPTFVINPAGGTLLPGPYLYVLSAYKDANSLETMAPAQINILVRNGSNTNRIILTLPPLPAGADGFNVYRRRQGAAAFHYLASIDMTVATPPSTWTDNGSIVEDPDRGLPQRNTTNAQNSIIVTLPGATPVVPVGFTWRLYRTLISGQYSSSLLHWVVEETAEGSGIITPTFTDLGYQTAAAQPPTALFNLANPERILLTNGAEVQGSLPPARMVFKDTVEFRHDGVLTTGIGTQTWRCPYEQAFIVAVVASLGRGAMASGADDLIDVNKWDSSLATPVWVSIFSENPAKMPRIVVGHNESAEKVPDIRSLVKGDKLSYDIDQVGGAATPLDKDLLVQIIIFHRDSTAASIVFP